MVERKYYAVSEKMARFANDANSMRSYSAGSATNEYKHYVDLVYYYVDRIAEEKPNLLEKAEWMAERYSRKLAEYYNAYYRNEASCPSILVSGAGNFPVKKRTARTAADTASCRTGTAWKNMQSRSSIYSPWNSRSSAVMRTPLSCCRAKLIISKNARSA